MSVPIGPQWIVRKKRMVAYAKKRGIVVPPVLKVNAPYCGSACRALIRRIQLSAWGANAATGKWTQKLRVLVTPKLTKNQKALALARTQIGVKENPPGSNDGKQVRNYQRVTGAFRAPWCASFIAWLYSSTGAPLHGFNTAYVPSYVENARLGANKLGLVVIPALVVPGDLACYDWTTDSVADHIGIVASKVDAAGVFTAIEGNTSTGNDSNGGEVQLRTRNVRQVQNFIRVKV